MSYEMGGRADKRGNRYEDRWAVYQILKVLEESIDYVILEALGEDEKGIDIWIGNRDGNREGQQCKGRNGSKEYWEFGDANAKGIFTNWKYQLDRDVSNTVALVSPLPFILLEGLIQRADNTNNNPLDFYNNQILNSSKDIVNFFTNFCRVMELDPTRELDLIKCINYLKRIAYRQWPDTESKEIILGRINLLLVGNEKDIYDAFIAWIVDGDILGKEINQTVLYNFLNEKGIKRKDLSFDTRIIPKLSQLNREYRAAFFPLNNGMIERKEFSICREAIELGNSLIIHGKAGRGKSGCTEDIINYCEENELQYLAIKLDKRIPKENAERWGEVLGLPSSIAHCIHSVSKNQRAVIILDQLDALRWTQAHSKDALLVCSQIINQVERLNWERKNKISIVFVCRTYDLENDNNIKALFKIDDTKSERVIWNNIHVDELDEVTVREIIGEQYDKLTAKMKELLRIPSNIYIWQHLDPSKEYNECSTASHLISKWWGQLCRKCFEFGLSESSMNDTKEKLIISFEKVGRIYIPLNILNTVNNSTLDFLSSNGFLVVQDNKVSFTHQSILDCFLAEKMLMRYYLGEDIIEIIGSKEKQTPGKRYQVQMVMQNLLETDSKDFISVGQKIFDSEQVRYNVKYIFFEVLNQLDVLDKNIRSFVIEKCEDEKYVTHIINSVVFSKPQYISLLRETGILDKWFNNEKKDIVFNLIISMSPKYGVDDVEFINKHIFQSEEDDNKFSRCFFHDINQDIDEMFELRMNFYQKYPKMADNYLDFKSMLKNCEMRTIRVFAFLLGNQIKNKGKNFYRFEEEFLHEDSDILIKNGMDVVDMLVPLIPTEEKDLYHFSDWSGRYFYKIGLERACIQIIKKANAAIIASNPEVFWECYEELMGKGNSLYNEILLDAFYLLPDTYSDAVIKCLYNDFDNNLFDKTSGNGDELLLAKSVIRKHSQYCSQIVFDVLVETVIKYISPQAKDTYTHRINYNRENTGCHVYWSFWGDLQKEILEVLPYDRLSKKAKDLLCVLNRKFYNGTTSYKYSNGHSGWVSSPVVGKKLNNKNWLEIITNKKLNHKSHSRWKEVTGGLIESSIEEFARSFGNAVSEEPERMIKLILSSNEEIRDVYIDSFFSGVAYSTTLNDVSIELLETMILRYKYDYTSFRASSICTLIEKRKNVHWSQSILDILKDIAVNHKNPEIGTPNVTKSEDKEMRSFDMLQSNAINCVRGRATEAIAHLLWENRALFDQFKSIIEKLVSDENPAVKLASLYALWPSYNIDTDWTSERILSLYEEDYRLAGFYGTKNMLFSLYSKYGERVLNIIIKCYQSEDKDLIEMGAHCLVEMFILNNEFTEEMNSVDAMSKEQAQAILHMVTIYFDKDEYNSIAKNIIRKFMNSSLDLEIPISGLFYRNLIDLERDKEFLIEIVDSELSRRIVYSFIHYLEEESKSLIDYKDIIISMSYNLINKEHYKDERIWGIEDDISKLIIGLYDETAESEKPELKNIANECLELWDLMYEKQIGSVRMLSQKMMDR